ncbi:M48 family metallopeptidase [Methanocella conradii]|uniref:M48 family metallopeptidase n=1 Tax=Methanocella conradii TaxID=1175444 RepID=UPI00157CAFEE|nr:SprT family zinc-dependent metalloprotease [Methanocella conradii]
MIEYDQIQYGQTIISYSISYSVRRKNATIVVHPTRKVEVKVPARAEPEDIRVLMQRKAKWVVTHIDWFSQFQYIGMEKEYVNGETFLYMGRQYRLKILKSDNEHYARLKGKYFEVTLPSNISSKGIGELAREALFDWYKIHAEKQIGKIVDSYSKKLGIEKPSFKVKYQSKRWGSCTNKNHLNFNLLIVMAPVSQIEYVVAHELCHIKHKSHSKEFWQLLKLVMPDYELRKDSLRRDGWKYAL